MGNNKPPYKIALGVLLLLVVVLLSGSQIAAALESASSTGDESQSINQLSDEQVENYITAAKNARASEETLCDLSLDLAGGSISNLSAQGWVQGTESDTWTKQFNKGEQLSLATPVRHGYSFVGWDSNGDNSVDIQPGGSEYTVPDADTQTLTAVWEREDFTVSFVVDGEAKLSVRVPYESTLWSDETQAPWEGACVFRRRHRDGGRHHL